MGKDDWGKIIKDASVAAGTYQPFFDSVIDQLAEIMATKDAAREQFESTGGKPVVAHTNKAGHTNLVKHPALRIIQECDAQALSYWRDLGLTPKGFKALEGKLISERSASFEEVLAGLGL